MSSSAFVLLYRHKHGEEVSVWWLLDSAYQAAARQITADCKSGRIDDPDVLFEIASAYASHDFKHVIDQAHKYWAEVSEGDRYTIYERDILW